MWVCKSLSSYGSGGLSLLKSLVKSSDELSSSLVKISSCGNSLWLSLESRIYLAIYCLNSSSFYCITLNSLSIYARKSSEKYLWCSSSSTEGLNWPSITRHYLKKSSSIRLMSFRSASRLTSLASVSSYVVAVGTFIPSNIEFILKATLYFFDSS